MRGGLAAQVRPRGSTAAWNLGRPGLMHRLAHKALKGPERKKAPLLTKHEQPLISELYLPAGN